MAREWIAWSKGFAKKPEVLQLAADFGVSRQHAAACCMEVWEWFDENTTDGHAPSVTRFLLDDIAGRPGFTDAMIRVGWLTLDGEKLSIPKFDRWNSQTSKARLLGTLRKQKQRTAAGQVSRNGHAASVTKQGTKARPEVEVEKDLTTSPTDKPAASPAKQSSKISKPTAPKKPRKDQWALDLFPTFQAVAADGLEYRDGMPLLSKLAGQFTQETVIAVVQAMHAKGEKFNRNGGKLWEVLTARCKERNGVPPVGRNHRKDTVEYSPSNTKGMEFYLDQLPQEQIND